MTAREQELDLAIRKAGLEPAYVGFSTADQPWARFRVGTKLVMVTAGAANTDREAGADIARQALGLGIAKKPVARAAAR